jgi:hypothetical protein
MSLYAVTSALAAAAYMLALDVDKVEEPEEEGEVRDATESLRE